MQDAQYFRAQAELCLRLSDAGAAENVRVMAASYLERAEQLERAQRSAALPASRET